jgi:hypothetical protein
MLLEQLGTGEIDTDRAADQSRVAMVSTDQSKVRCGVSSSPALMRRATLTAA